jgi:hypothetical protein
MKKIYLFGLSLVAISAVNGQIQKNYGIQKMNLIGEKAPKVAFSESKTIPFFTNGFSTETEWVTANSPTGTPPHTQGDWVVTNGVVNFPTVALNPAGFASAANGYAWINSDAAGNGQTQNADIRFNSNIDCSTHPTVNLKFSHITRHFQETYFVIVSNDGGATWTEFQVNQSQAVNTNSANPASIQLNITSVAGGQANVRIGFRYKGNYDWFWAVDDVEMAELEENDITLNSIYWGVEGNWGPRLPYYKTPLAQADEVVFSAVAMNNGSLPQTVTFGGAIPSPVFAGSSAPFLLPVATMDTLDLTTGFTPSTIGSFAFTGTLSNGTDANPADNTLPAIAFSTTNHDYSRTLPTATGGLFNQGDKYVMGNIYDIQVSGDATGIRAFIASTSVAGQLFSAKIYGTEGAEFDPIAETELHELTTGELGTFVTLQFDSPVPLDANKSYLVAINTPGAGGVGNDIVLGASGVSEKQTTYLQDETLEWFYMTTTPMVELTFDPSLSLEDAESNSFGVSIYPNPASEEVKVSFNLNGAASASVNVIDMTGKVVASQEAAAGSNAVSINTSNLSAGVYSVSFTANNTTVTKKLVVKK